MTIANQNVKIYRGNSETLNIEITTITGNPYAPAAGDEVKYRLARNATSPESESFVIKSLAAGNIVIVDGVATIELSAIDTDLAPGVYYHELKVIDPPDDVATAMTGTVIIKPSLRMSVSLSAAPLATSSPGLNP